MPYSLGKNGETRYIIAFYDADDSVVFVEDYVRGAVLVGYHVDDSRRFGSPEQAGRLLGEILDDHSFPARARPFVCKCTITIELGVAEFAPIEG